MSQREIELILTRQLASYLALPAFLVDAGGTLLYYNEAAEGVLGMRFDETGEMSAEKWATAFTPVDEEGRPLPPKALPLVIAVTEGRPAHRRFWIAGLDGARRLIEVTAFPLVGKGERILGGLAMFWEAEDG